MAIFFIVDPSSIRLAARLTTCLLIGKAEKIFSEMDGKARCAPFRLFGNAFERQV